MEVLFGKEGNLIVLARFKRRIDGLSTSTDFEKQRNNFVRLVVASMEANSSLWDKYCQINIKWIGEHFINIISEEMDLDKVALDGICSMCFRFIFEYFLSTENDLSMDFEAAKRFVLNNLDSFEEVARNQIEFSIREMPIKIFKSIAHSEAINSLKDFNAISLTANNLKITWESELNARELRVDALKSSLEKYENAFNFVGLYQGFDELAREKNKEKGNLLILLSVLSVLIISPVLAQIALIYINIDNINSIKDGLLFSVFPTVSFVLISLYYFKVVLVNYKSVKSQLLQIDLRKTLCRFIQNYAEYSSDLKKRNEISLDKFESVIFSGIVSDEGSLPSTFDGMEQIEKLIKTVKS